MKRNMKKLLSAVLMCLMLVACTKAPTWQEQYDLGVRYLSEGNYEEAIIAFTVAIRIDPKQENAYIGLADAYVGAGDTEKAVEVLEKAMEAVGENEALTAALAALLPPESKDVFYNSEKFEDYNDLSNQWKNYLLAVVNAFETNQSDEVLKVLRERNTGTEEGLIPAGNGAVELRTVLKNYKLRWTRMNVHSTNGSYWVEVEIRPENGIAYCASYNDNHGPATYESTYYVRGECSNWNWNGEYESHQWRGAKNLSQEWFKSGKMVDCLSDGIATGVYKQRDVSYFVEDEYEYGRRVTNDNSDDKYHSAANSRVYNSLGEAKSHLWWN